MPIDSVGSYEDIYSDDIAEILKTNDKPPAAWNGRTVLTSKENRSMHSMLGNSLAHKNAKSRKKDNKLVVTSCASSPAFGGFNFNSNPDFNPFIKLPAAYNPPPPPVYTPPPLPPPVFVQPPLPPRPITINLPLPPPPSFDPSNKYDPPKLLNPTSTSSTLNSPPPVATPTVINPIQATPSTVISSPPISEPLFPSEVDCSGGHLSIATPNLEVQKEKIVDISKEEPWTDFVKGFARGLPNGSVDSIKEIPSAVVTAVETAATLHSLLYPIVPNQQTVVQLTSIYETIAYLGTCNGSELAKIVVPEAHHLFTNWDNLPLKQKGEHLAHCIGKYGTDFLLPIAAAKGTKVVGGVLKEAAVLGKLEGVIGSVATETKVLGAAQGSSKLAQGAVPIAERQVVIEKALLPERTQKEILEVIENTKKTTTIANPQTMLNITDVEKRLFSTTFAGETITGVDLTFETLLRASLEPDRAGFTKAGRALMKHGYREGSVFPKPLGNAVEVNEHGQKVLMTILNHPESQVAHYNNKNYGVVIEVKNPKLGGVRFSGDGKKMIGFLEPE